MYLKRIGWIIWPITLTFLFVVPASAFEIVTVLSDTLKADTAKTNTTFYPTIQDTDTWMYRDSTFDTDGRTKILTKDGKKFLHFELSLSKKYDKIKQVYLGKYIIYDSSLDTMVELGKYKQYTLSSVSVRHGFFQESRKEEKEISMFKKEKYLVSWTEDNMELRGKYLMDTANYTGTYRVVFDRGMDYQDTVEFDIANNSIRRFWELSMGLTLGSDRRYTKDPDAYNGDYRGTYGLDYYSFAYGFRIKDFLSAIKVDYNGFDDKWEKKKIKYRTHNYRWEVQAYMSQGMWFSFDGNVELRAGYKIGTLRGFYREHNTETQEYKQFYNFLIKDHGLSLGGGVGYKSIGAKYEYSWLYGGYHSFSFYSWAIWSRTAHGGIIFKYNRGKNLAEFMTLLELRIPNDKIMASYFNSDGEQLTGVMALGIYFWTMLDSLARLLAGTHAWF
ncbi:MAG: hypothetical protein A2145_00930 [candidate division Zixibacteria bacterium RBG_16_40_9]|nr:MAG: hypothetical protein A2145_00930 [candidate division Zixibacteria bacterium RBG_16_40_9]